VSYKAPDGFDPITAAICIALAGFGGLMSYLIKTIDSGKHPSWGRSALECGGSMFMGAMVYLLCTAMKWEGLWTMVFAGLSGWMGSLAVVRMFEALILKRAGLTREDLERLSEKADG
jgi:hypothetical protein